MTHLLAEVLFAFVGVGAVGSIIGSAIALWRTALSWLRHRASLRCRAASRINRYRGEVPAK